MVAVSTYSRQDSVSPQELGLNGVTLDVARTSNVFATEGFNQMIVHVRLTWAAATSVTFFVETVVKPHTLLAPVPANTFERVVTASTAAGTVTLSQLVASRAVTANENWQFILGIAGWRARLTFPIATGATTDTAVVWVELNNT